MLVALSCLVSTKYQCERFCSLLNIYIYKKHYMLLLILQKNIIFGQIFLIWKRQEEISLTATTTNQLCIGSWRKGKRRGTEASGLGWSSLLCIWLNRTMVPAVYVVYLWLGILEESALVFLVWLVLTLKDPFSRFSPVRVRYVNSTKSRKVLM